MLNGQADDMPVSVQIEVDILVELARFDGRAVGEFAQRRIRPSDCRSSRTGCRMTRTIHWSWMKTRSGRPRAWTPSRPRTVSKSGWSHVVSPHADAMRLEDPDAAAQRLPFEVGESRAETGADAASVLPGQTQHQHAR